MECMYTGWKTSNEISLCNFLVPFFLLAQNFSKKSIKSVLLYNFFCIVYNTTDVKSMLRQIDKTSKSKVFATCIC